MKKQRQESVWDIFTGKKVVLQAKGGLRYKGDLVAVRDGYLVLTDAVIFGKQFTAKANLLAVHHTLIAHIHTEPISLEEVKKS